MASFEEIDGKLRFKAEECVLSSTTPEISSLEKEIHSIVSLHFHDELADESCKPLTLSLCICLLV